MQALPGSALATSPSRTHTRTVVIASADGSFRQRIAETLRGLRWQVREVEGGAQAWAEVESAAPEAIIVDSWLPDLEMTEFLKEFRGSFPNVDVITGDGDAELDGPRGPCRRELLYTLRRSQDNDTAVWNTAPMLSDPMTTPVRAPSVPGFLSPHPEQASATSSFVGGSVPHLGSVSISGKTVPIRPAASTANPSTLISERLPELIGNHPVSYTHLDVYKRQDW